MVCNFSYHLQYGIGQWSAIKMAIRRSPQFRFDYFFRSLPIDVIGRRCETLMKAALKEVEFLEKKVREDMGLPAEASEGVIIPPITLPKFKDIQKNNRAKKMAEREKEKKSLEEKVETLEQQIEEIQNRLKQLSKDPDSQKKKLLQNEESFTKQEPSRVVPISPPIAVVEESIDFDETKGAIGPQGDYVEFPHYDGSETPKEPRKAFAQFCQRTRKSVKNSLEPQDRRNKEKVNGILRARFTALSDEERRVYRDWASWDKLRHARDLEIFEKVDSRYDTTDEQSQTPKKKRSAPDSLASVPKKKKL
jgi:SWI/SNF-related matrix-associated actin-dependent regulator of chromatin subfamily A member 5